MTPGETCSTCKAFAALSNECRRKSPTEVPIPQPNGLKVLGIYPGTSKDGWCCEWRSAIEAPNGNEASIRLEPVKR